MQEKKGSDTFIAVMAIMGISGVARAYFGIGAPRSEHVDRIVEKVVDQATSE